MPFIQSILKFLDYQIETPKPFGAFHIVFLILSVAAGIVLCVLWNRGIINDVRNVLLVTGLIVISLEVYKQINYSFGYEGGITFNYQWHAFPWQFYSTPMYICVIAGLTKGRIYDHLCSFLSTFALFAGAASMIYPADVFVGTLGINIQSMISFGSIIAIAIFLYYTQHVDTSWNTLLKAVPVFAITLSTAVILNEVAHLIGITAENTFNMFFVSPHHESTLPVYSLIHNAIMGANPALYPICLILYIIGFTVCAGAMLLLARGVEYVATMDYDAQYAEMDARRRERSEQRKERLNLLEEERRIKLEEKRLRKKLEKEEERERKKIEREERREQREIEKDEKRDEMQRERARRKREKKQEKKERAKYKKKARKEKKKEKELQKKKERREERRLEKRMKEIEKREKKEAKERKKAEKEFKRAKKAEKKALKLWLKQQKKLGISNPDIDIFYDLYYRN